jgi:hypothetical protein
LLLLNAWLSPTFSDALKYSAEQSAYTGRCKIELLELVSSKHVPQLDTSILQEIPFFLKKKKQ